MNDDFKKNTLKICDFKNEMSFITFLFLKMNFKGLI